MRDGDVLMAKNDGGSAFPETSSRPDYSEHGREFTNVSSSGGMSLRDWFAGQALTGIMGDSGMRPSNTEEFEHLAKRLYSLADAMLAEREK